MKRILWKIAAVAALVTVAVASTPQMKNYQSQKDFEKGEPKGTSVTARGEIQLAPELEPLYESPAPFLWSVVRDSKGVIYTAGGNDGKVYRIDHAGNGSVYFEAPEVEIYAMAVDASDNLYVGTSPEGKIYRLSGAGATPEESVFFDPEDLYIWAIVVDKKGNLLVGTGDQGVIYKVDSQGRGEVLFDSEEAHIRALALDSKGNLLAGTATNGILYRIGVDGKVFVLYDSPMQELHTLQVAANGDVYAGGLGQTLIRPRPTQPVAVPTPVTLEGAAGAEGREREIDLGAQQVTAGRAPSTALPAAGRRIQSALYRVRPDGTVRNLWRVQADRVQAIALESEGTVLVGTGDRGRVYRLTNDGERMLLFQLDQSQVTAMATEPGGGVLLATSNLGQLYRLKRSYRRSGTYLSEVLDTKVISQWGSINWESEAPKGTRIEISTRSGNTEKPDKTWSDWSPAYAASGELITSPTARFLQWRAKLSTRDGRRTPLLNRVSLAYLQRNVTPELTSVEVTQSAASSKETSSQAIGISAARSGSQGRNSGRNGKSPTLARERTKKNQLKISWKASDDNGDDLLFDLFYRGEGETVWKPLTEDHKGKSYTLDPELLPDGRYVVKVVASDEPSNPPALALKAERISEPFTVDNTGPKVQQLRVVKKKEGYQATFVVQDALNAVTLVEYTVDVEGWKLVYPEDGITDSKREVFRLAIADPGAGRHTLVIRAEDALGNVGYGKITFP
jgi:sugar lactone lactonase YvrE